MTLVRAGHVRPRSILAIAAVTFVLFGVADSQTVQGAAALAGSTSATNANAGARSAPVSRGLIVSNAAGGDTGGYPYADMPCVWAPYATDGTGHWCMAPGGTAADPGACWGTVRDSCITGWYSEEYLYAYRNCTDYVAWRLASLGVKPALFPHPGNGKDWVSAPVTVDENPAVGAVAISTSGAFGHVAFVESVDGTRISVSEYNNYTGPNPNADGKYGTRTGDWRKLGFTRFAHFEQYETAAPRTITFSEYQTGTQITTQYTSRGIVFGGDIPFITSDLANPTSPVLSGSPLFFGAITGTFVVPGSTRPTTVQAFTLDVGYIDAPNSVEVRYFDAQGRTIGSVLVGLPGIITVEVTSAKNIRSFVVHTVGTEPAGFAIDNVLVGLRR